MDCSVLLLLGIYTCRKRACVLLTIIAWVAHRYGQLYLHCSLIYFVPSSCFCIVISLSEGWNNLSPAVSASRGRLHYPRRRRWSHTDWQTALMCNRRRPAATSSRRASFSALASANSFVYFASSAANIPRWTHLHVSNCRVRQLQFSGIFVALGFVGNGVITVMINSPQADDDADNQSGDNRGDSAHTYQSLWPFRPLLNFAIRLSALCLNWP